MRWGRVAAAFLFVTALLTAEWLWLGRGAMDEPLQARVMSGTNAGAIPGGDFALTDHHGRPVTRASFDGRLMLLAFGYTACPDICPLTLSTMAEGLALLGPLADKIQPVFVTLDPERDDTAALAGYLPQFDPRILGLTGSLEAVSDMARKYRVRFEKSGEGPDYGLDHSMAFYLVGPEGKVLTYFEHSIDPRTLVQAVTEEIGNSPGV